MPKSFCGFTFAPAEIILDSTRREFDTINEANASLLKFRAGEYCKDKEYNAARRLYLLSALHSRKVIALAPLRKRSIKLDALCRMAASECEKDFIKTIEILTKTVRLYPDLTKCMTIKYKEFIYRRKKWICSINEIKLIKQYFPKKKSIFDYLRTINPRISFDLGIDKVDNEDLEILFSFSASHEAIIEISNQTLTENGLICFSKSIAQNSSVEKVILLSETKTEISLNSFQGEKVFFENKCYNDFAAILIASF